MGMTGYIEVAGRRTWHQVSGAGEPLVLLHGGFVGASSFFAQVPALVEAGYRVHVPERRGQAHTPDVEGPVNYSVMAYDPVSPDGPGHFPVVHAKMMQMFATEPEIALDTLAGVTAPTLVLQGDRDEVTVEHSLAVVAALPEARLAVLPGTHTLPLEHPELVNPLIVSFLRDTNPAPDWDAFTG